MMKKLAGEWVCPSCEPTKTEENTEREYGRDAVLLRCPYCQKRRPYCGAEGAPLGGPRLYMGIDRHLKSHDIEEERREEIAANVIESREQITVRSELCDEADNRGWDYYKNL